MGDLGSCTFEISTKSGSCLRFRSGSSFGHSFSSITTSPCQYDFALLGLTTFLAGLLGVPTPIGLIPQAPIHTRSLLVHVLVPKEEACFATVMTTDSCSRCRSRWSSRGYRTL
ncbi:hypothetical protein BJV74DRAFT_511271 [Russula compacta]|nr:hypothetical protein BJV74DRAFT_511271 [Russula compacta]